MPPTRSSRQSTRRSRAPPEVIDISDEDDERQPKPVRRRHSGRRKPIFIDLCELADDNDDDVDRTKFRHAPLRGKKYDDDDDVDDGLPFPEITFQLPPPPTYEQVLAEVEPGMRALGAPDWAVDMAAELMFSVEYELDYQTLLQLDEVVETSTANITHFMGTVNRARGNGEKTRYELCTFKNGMYPCREPYNLRSIFTVRDLEFLTMRDLRWYILGYLGSDYAVPETRGERVRLLKGIIGIVV